MLRNWRERNWKPMCDDAVVTAAPYQLRHSCASGLIYEGRPLPEVAAIMGHGLDLLMSRYAHVIEGARQREPVSYAEAAMRARTGEDAPPVLPESDSRRESARRSRE
jgi:integrase